MTIRILTTLLLAGSLCGCGATRSVPLTVSPTVPAASGSVAARKGANDNTQLTLRVEHLAPPERLTPPASVYVVWTQSLERGRSQNVGALRLDKDLSGRLETKTPLEAFRVFVTPEASPTVEEPTGTPVLTAEIVR